MQKQLSVVLVGAGDRGRTYTDIMAEMPQQYKVVAVAEPLESRREYIRAKHHLLPEQCYADWQSLFAQAKIADLALICTLDRDHFLPAMAATRLGYDLLLEKPVSPDPESCERLAQAAEQAGTRVVVCHVLRYTPLFTAIKALIEEDCLGEIISVNHEENVGNRHQSHSFVRGNWGNTGRSSNMLLQKSCHDLDILQWLIGKNCRKIQSFGSLRYFTRANAPKDAPERCLEGCPHGESCPYNAVKLYLDDKQNAWFREACTRKPSPSDEDVAQALRTTQYGKCVFKCDNDVVDHQTVNMLFDDGVTATFTMCAFNRGGRFIHIMGTKGELRASLTSDEEPIRLYDFETKTTREIPVSGKEGLDSGHGGGDRGIILSLYDYLSGSYRGSAISHLRISVDNHLLAFAAEESREKGSVVDVDAYRAALDRRLNSPRTACREEALRKFCPQGLLVALTPYGSGHIHDTFLALLLEKDGTERKMILQRINKTVFRNPEKTMENITHITEYLRQQIAEEGGDPARETLCFLPYEGKPFYRDTIGEYWRCCPYIEGTATYDIPEDPALFKESALAFGRFQQRMTHFPADTLFESIPHFHDTPARLEALREAVNVDAHRRADEARDIIQAFFLREELAFVYADALAQGRVKIRVTHNDTKMNNVLFDSASRGICVIDLDTVMPGLIMNDFGDAIRFGCNRAGESADPALVHVDMALFEQFARGWLKSCGHQMTREEIRLLPTGAMVMTYESGLRFLTDYLQGDEYFKISRDRENLDRARSQLALLQDMEDKWEEMNRIIREIAEEEGLI